VLGKRKKNDSLKPEVSIAGSSNLSIQEKENVARYQENTSIDTFSMPSPIRRVFQNLPQVPVSELMDMEVDDNPKVQGINLFLLIYY
jgi:hypothetical protein